MVCNSNHARRSGTGIPVLGTRGLAVFAATKQLSRAPMLALQLLVAVRRTKAVSHILNILGCSSNMRQAYTKRLLLSALQRGLRSPTHRKPPSLAARCHGQGLALGEQVGQDGMVKAHGATVPLTTAALGHPAPGPPAHGHYGGTARTALIKAGPAGHLVLGLLTLHGRAGLHVLLLRLPLRLF